MVSPLEFHSAWWSSLFRRILSKDLLSFKWWLFIQILSASMQLISCCVGQQIFWFLLSMDFHAGYWTSCFTKTCWIKSFLLTKNIFVHRTRIHKSLSYHRKAGIGSHLIINDKNCIKIFKRQTEQWVLTVLFTSNIKSGFFMKFTQNRNGRQLDFQACKTFKLLKLVYDII